MLLRRATLTLDPLAVSHGDSSTEVSPSNLSDSSGKFRIGGFEIGRDGVTDLTAAASSPLGAAAPVVRAPTHAAAAASEREISGIDFKDLQPLQIIGRGASGR